MSEIKKLQDITRDEWVVWYWISVGDHENFNKYIRGVYRDPSDAIKAGREWDEWHSAYEALKNA